jgi:hypothetical protein
MGQSCVYLESFEVWALECPRLEFIDVQLKFCCEVVRKNEKTVSWLGEYRDNLLRKHQGERIGAVPIGPNFPNLGAPRPT